MTTAKRPSKSRRAYHWIKERIASSHYTPGYRLVLGSIAAELDMSVVPVREAVRQLEAEGLVIFEHNVGARVAMVDETQYRFTMQTIAVVESAATAMAAPHLTPDDLGRARALNDVLSAGLTRFDPHAFSVVNQQFHQVLYSRCDNPRLLEIVTTEWSRLGNLRDSIFSFVPGRAAESVREHEVILDLIESGAPADEIEAAMRAHRAGTLRAYLSHDHGGHRAAEEAERELGA